jgi:ComF family protein
VAKDLVHRLKFERARAAAKIMADRVAVTLSADADLLISHLPTANSRVRQRGYDQAQLIAKRLGKRTGLPYSVLLARQDFSRQLGQTRQMRFKQMQTAFRPVRAGEVEGRRILLVDDVLTTGASLEAAARALRVAGAKRVSAAVFAAA